MFVASELTRGASHQPFQAALLDPPRHQPPSPPRWLFPPLTTRTSFDSALSRITRFPTVLSHGSRPLLSPSTFALQPLCNLIQRQPTYHNRPSISSLLAGHPLHGFPANTGQLRPPISISSLCPCYGDCRPLYTHPDPKTLQEEASGKGILLLVTHAYPVCLIGSRMLGL